jgi:acetyltransferase-like isoleucine patch superfamily enzyme
MGIHSSAVIDLEVEIGSGVTIEPFTIIKKGSVIEDGARISSCVRIEENCLVGKNTFIGHGTVLRPHTRIYNGCVIGHLTVFEGRSTVLDGTLIHAQCHITRGVSIGRNVFIAPLFVGANDTKMCHKRDCLDFEVKGYKIGDGARIAIGVTVLPDVYIGTNAMIGAGSLVTKDIPKDCIAYGNPARVVGKVPKEERL